VKRKVQRVPTDQQEYGPRLDHVHDFAAPMHHFGLRRQHIHQLNYMDELFLREREMFFGEEDSASAYRRQSLLNSVYYAMNAAPNRRMNTNIPPYTLRRPQHLNAGHIGSFISMNEDHPGWLPRQHIALHSPLSSSSWSNHSNAAMNESYYPVSTSSRQPLNTASEPQPPGS